MYDETNRMASVAVEAKLVVTTITVRRGMQKVKSSTPKHYDGCETQT